MRNSAVAAFIVAHKQSISEAWERAVLPDLKELGELDRGALIDHLPEVLTGLAAHLAGQTDDAERAFAALADGHAVQRLGSGIELAVVNAEYGRLRSVLLRELLAVESSPEVREDLVRLDEGLDRAIQLAVRRYTDRRDHVRNLFLGILGHDLRNPLSAASLAAASLLQSSTLSLGDRRRVEMAARASARMTRMVGDLLEFARSQLGGGLPTTPVLCAMGEICRAAAEESRLAHPDRDIRVEARGDLRGTFDRDRALQAMGNLVANAVQHGEDPIVIGAWEADDRQAVFTRVSNRGASIPSELIPNLFDPFRLVGKEHQGHLGLGLFIVAQIARAHGGTCEVTSSGSETAFTIRWPRVPLTEVPDRT